VDQEVGGSSPPSCTSNINSLSTTERAALCALNFGKHAVSNTCRFARERAHVRALHGKIRSAALAGMSHWSDEETDNPLRADDRNFYKVEKWTKDGTKIERLLYAGNNLERAPELFAEAIKHRPRIRLTIRQRTRVLEQWPKEQ
jgi:hypothetical protein